jgi:queuine tRNA-ribosyltransferase
VGLKFTIHHRDPASRARCGTWSTDRGPVDTPQFMPVGTRATVKGILPRDLREMGATVLLANAFHLALRPGASVVRELGGLHRMMAWEGPILTDSGGFQVFSLADMRKITDHGVSFKSPVDGSLFTMTPESCMELQRALGADFIMQLDLCPGGDAARAEVEFAVEQSLKWAKRCADDHRRARTGAAGPVLLGIVQGGIFDDLRERSARELLNIGFEAYAIGGLSVGESKDGMRAALEVTDRCLPDDCPRYLMGVGHPADFADAIERGVDLFDCVAPTREGRNGRAYTSRGFVHIRNASLATDPAPLDPECTGICCNEYSKGTLRHLFHAGEMLGPILLSLHNVRYFLEFMKGARAAIAKGTFAAFAARARDLYPQNTQSEP